MKFALNRLLIITILFGGVLLVSCQPTSSPTGLLQGGVTIGPLTPVQQVGVCPTAAPEVFSSRNVIVSDTSGKNQIQVSIRQIGQTAQGYYSVQLPAGTYTVDMARTGVGGVSNLPQKITIKAGETVTIDLNIDTGIR
jgi:hypothetical protein